MEKYSNISYILASCVLGFLIITAMYFIILACNSYSGFSIP